MTASQCEFDWNIDMLSSSCDSDVDSPQPKILDGRTSRSMSRFEALFKCVSTRFGLQNVEKYFEKTRRTFRSAFQNLRLGAIKLSSTCTSPLKKVACTVSSQCWHARSFNTVDPRQHHSVSSTDTVTVAVIHRHAIHILWVGQTHQKSIFILCLWSSLCTSPSKRGWHARSFNTLDPRQHHSVSSTDTSTCYPHLVSCTDISECYLHLDSWSLSITNEDFGRM